MPATGKSFASSAVRSVRDKETEWDLWRAGPVGFEICSHSVGDERPSNFAMFSAFLSHQSRSG